MEIITPEEYKKLTPYAQGYATYMQGDWPESQIPNGNPYHNDEVKRGEWNRGNFAAMLAVQDSEE